jgi:hypothetical protein
MNKIIKRICASIIIFLTLIFCCIFSLHIPFVQKKLINYGQTYLSKNFNIKTEIDDFKIDFPLNFSFQKINVQLEDGTKINVHDIDISPSLTSLKIDSLRVQEISIENSQKTEPTKKTDVQENINTVLSVLRQTVIDEFSIQILKQDSLDLDLSITYKRNKKGHDLIIGTKEDPCALMVGLNNIHHQINGTINYTHKDSSPFGLQFEKHLTNEFKNILHSIDGTFCFHCDESMKFSTSIIIGLKNGPITIKGKIEKDQFDIDLKDESKISYPLFNKIEALHIKGQYIKDCLNILDFKCCGENQSINIKGNIQDPLLMMEERPHVIGNFDIVYQNNNLIDFLAEGQLKTSVTVSYKDGVLDCSQKICNPFKGQASESLLSEEIILLISKKDNQFSLTLNGLVGTQVMLNTQNNFKETIFHIKKNNEKSLFESSKISIKQNDNGTFNVNGYIKPIGENIIKTNLNLRGSTNELNGKIFINIKDMAPITTPFDFATVGRIKGDLLFKKLSFSKKSGSLDIDLHSKYFRSPLFKSALTTIKGIIQGDQKTNIVMNMEELAIGKGFLAEKSSLNINGVNGIFDISLKSNSHKKGYLSADLDINIQTILDSTQKTIDIKTFSILHAKQKLSLQNPLHIRTDPLSISDAHFLLNDDGHIQIKSIKKPNHQNKQWSGSLNAEDISLEILSWFFPKSIITGSLDATINLQGTDDVPDFKIKIDGHDIEWLQFHGLSEQNNLKKDAINFTLAAESLSHILKWDLNLDAKKNVHITSSGNIPLKRDSDQKINGVVNGFIDLSLISAIIATGDRLSGPIHFKLNLSGDIQNPIWNGDIQTQNAYVELAEFGTVINKINGNIKANGKHWIIEGITATDEPFIHKSKKKKFGDLVLKGGIEFKSLLEPLVNLELIIRNYQLVDSDSIQGRGTGHLTITGEGIHALIKGYADIHDLTVNLDNLETEDTIPTITLKDPKKRTYAKEYQKEKHKFKQKEILPLDLVLKSNDNVSIFGLIISKSLWGGNLNVKGPINNPYLIGDVHLLKGEVDLFGKTLKIDKGNVSFDERDKNSPLLSIQGSRKVADITVILNINNKQNPIITFDSSPSMAQDEILSWLLFGKSAGNVSVGQSLQLVNALAKLKGVNVLGLVDDIKKEIGIDTFDIRDQSTMTTSPSTSSDQQQINQVVHIGKKLTENIELSAEQGAVQGTGKIGIELDVGNNITISADVASSEKSSTDTGQGTSVNNSGASINWEKRY